MSVKFEDDELIEAVTVNTELFDEEFTFLGGSILTRCACKPWL